MGNQQTNGNIYEVDLPYLYVMQFCGSWGL